MIGGKHLRVKFTASAASVPPSALRKEQGRFTEVFCSTAGTIRVKGTGIVAYIASGASGTGYIDPATGAEFTGNASTNGYYEALPATAVPIAMVAGQTLTGSFTEVQTDSTFAGWGTAVSVDGAGSEYTFRS